MKHTDESIDLYKDTKVATNGTEAYVSVICPKCHKNGMFVDIMRLSEWKNGCRKWENGYSIREAFPNLTSDQQDMLENGKICFDCEYGEETKESRNSKTRSASESRKLVKEDWDLACKNLKTGKYEWLGTHPSLKFGLSRYAADCLDSGLKKYSKCDDIDLRDELIGDFMAAGGKCAIKCGDYVYFYAKHFFDPYGNVKREPVIPELANESKNLVKEGAGAGYTVHIKGLKTGKILNMQKKGEDPSDEYYEVEVEVVPCEVEVGAEDYYNDFFWQEHEWGDTPTAQIDGGVVNVVFTWYKDEDEIRQEIENTELDFDFDYGWGWTHVDLPKDKPINSDHIKTKTDNYYEIFEISLNAPDLADAVNCGHQSIYDRDEEEPEEEPEEDEDDVVTESYDDEWTSVGAAFDEFRQRLWKYTRKDRESRMEFFQDCMRKCEAAFKEYHDACVAED